MKERVVELPVPLVSVSCATLSSISSASQTIIIYTLTLIQTHQHFQRKLNLVALFWQIIYIYIYISFLNSEIIRYLCSCDQAMVCLTISAALPQLRPPPCAGNEVCQEANSKQMAILYFSLLLAAIGSGGIRPCVAAFGANQFVGVDSKHKTNTWVFFNWYYFVMGASMLLASTVLVYIQDNVGWGWGLGIPTVAMLLSIPIFVLGHPLYRFLDPAGSPFTRFLQVIVAAFRKRKVPMVSDPKMLYQNQEIDAPFSADGMLHHTKQFE
jgi:hypothetical protein